MGGGGRDDLLASIRTSGKGGLKKVSDTEKRDRSAAALPGGGAGAPDAPSGGGAGAPAGDAGGLAGALQAALNQRKKKVSGSGKFLLSLCCVARANDLLQMMKKMTMTIGSYLHIVANTLFLDALKRVYIEHQFYVICPPVHLFTCSPVFFVPSRCYSMI